MSGRRWWHEPNDAHEWWEQQSNLAVVSFIVGLVILILAVPR